MSFLGKRMEREIMLREISSDSQIPHILSYVEPRFEKEIKGGLSGKKKRNQQEEEEYDQSTLYTYTKVS